MINKAVLDALADVIKKERTRFEKAVAALRKDIYDDAEVNDLTHVESLQNFADTLAKLSIKLDEREVAIHVKLDAKGQVFVDEVNVALADLEQKLKEFKGASSTSLEKAIEKYGIDVATTLTASTVEIDALALRLVEEVRAELALVKDGIDGKDGAPGKNGVDGILGEPGKDGVDGESGIAGEKGEPGIDGADGKQGEAGKDGGDGADGESGIQGVAGIDGVDGAAGADGSSGAAGRDGADGNDGRDGSDGIDKYLVAPREVAADEKLDKGELVYSQGGLFQSIRKTTGCPENDPGSYRLVVNGLQGIDYHFDNRQLQIQIRLSDGTAFPIELPDTPRILAVKPQIALEGDMVFEAAEYSKYVDGNWLVTKLKGKQGDIGIRGRKGLKGDLGVGVEDVLMEGGHIIITLTNGEAKDFVLPVPELPQQIKMHGIHVVAPESPPEDYLWVSPKGHSKIWDGTKWIPLK
jgi:hypothetical protein